MLASYRGHVKIVELLLQHNSDVNLTTQVKFNTNDNYYAYTHMYNVMHIINYRMLCMLFLCTLNSMGGQHCSVYVSTMKDGTPTPNTRLLKDVLRLLSS